jgi:two-component system, NarL family, sensor histidine kinase UhpB
LDEGLRKERLRVSQDLHDDLGQILMALNLEFGLARQWLEPLVAADSQREQRVQAALDCLDRATGLVTRAEQAMREVVWNLRPAQGAGGLTRSELAHRLRGILQAWGEREGWTVAFDEQPPPSGLGEPDAASSLSPLSPSPAASSSPRVRAAHVDVITRAVQEALRNVARHGRARHVRLTLARLLGGWSVDIRDDGRGLPPGVSELVWGLGLQGLRERLDALGGRLRVSNHELGGCQVSLYLPDGPDPERVVT